MVALKPYIEMLQSSLPLEDERDAIADYKRLKTIMITEAEWTAIVDLIAILKPFNDVTKYVSSGMHPTMSIVYPTIVALRDSITKKHPAEDEGTEKIPGMEGDEDAFDGDVAYVDAPEEEDEPERQKRRKIRINEPADTTNLVERVTASMSALFEKYYPVSSID